MKQKRSTNPHYTYMLVSSRTKRDELGDPETLVVIETKSKRTSDWIVLKEVDGGYHIEEEGKASLEACLTKKGFVSYDVVRYPASYEQVQAKLDKVVPKNEAVETEKAVSFAE